MALRRPSAGLTAARPAGEIGAADEQSACTLLIFAAARLVFSGRQDQATPADGIVLRAVKRFVPVSPDSDGGRLISRAGGRDRQAALRRRVRGGPTGQSAS
jgi:hypothetical protein